MTTIALMNWIDRAIKRAEELGYSRREFAESIGVDNPRLTNWRQGTKIPYAHQALKMAQILGVSLDWLMTGVGQEGPSREGDLTDKERILIQTVRTLPVDPLEAIAALLERGTPARVLGKRPGNPGPSGEDAKPELPSVVQADTDRRKARGK